MTRTNHLLTLLAALVVLGAVAPATVAAGPQTNSADLVIDQPSYVDGSVGTDRADGQTVYIVQHGTVDIKPQNFATEDVVGFGVSTSEGKMTYDERMDTFTFRSQNNTGTFQLYWEVETTRLVQQNGTNATETVRQRYTATIRVEQNKAYQHVPAGSLDKTREAADNWEEWTGTLTSIYGDNVDIEKQTQAAVEFLKFKNNPVAMLSGEFTGLLLALIITLGGNLVLVLFGILHIASQWGGWRYIRRNEALKADEAAVDEKLEELDTEQRLRKLAKVDWNDLGWSDAVSRAYRQVGETPARAISRMVGVRLPHNVLNHRLQAMGQAGYVGVVDERKFDAVRTDGGDGGSDSDAPDEDIDTTSPITAARVVPESEVPADAQTHDLSDPSEDFLEAVDIDDTIRDFDLAAADVDPTRITVEQAPMDIEELMEELEVQRQDFDGPDEWGELLLEFVEFVREHEFCDEHGSPDEIQWVLNEWLDTDDRLADMFDLPHFKFESEALEFALEHRDPVDEASQLVTDVKEGRFA